jgi:hypothetical protein
VSLFRRLMHRSVQDLTRLAAALALLGMAIMAYSILSPRPLPVILAMSVGQLIGVVAVLCYLLAMVLASRASTSAPISETSAPAVPVGRSQVPEDEPL